MELLENMRQGVDLEGKEEVDNNFEVACKDKGYNSMVEVEADSKTSKAYTIFFI